MNFTRNNRSRRLSRVCAILLLCGSLRAWAGEAPQPSNSQLINFPTAEKVKAEDAVRMLEKQLQFDQSRDEFRSKFVEHPGDGLQVQRFNQYYQGLQVEHGSFSVTSKNGIASFAFGKFYPTSSVTGITPSIDEAFALNKAKAAVPAEKYAWESGAEEFPKGRVCLIEDFAKGEGDGQLHLAYAFDIYAEKPEARFMVYVDANDGHILFTDATLKHIGASGPSLYSGTVSFNAGLVAGTYYLYDSTRGGGIVTYNAKNSTNLGSATIITSTSTVFAKDPGIDAHWGASVVYDYWKNVQNRNSWNGSGGILRSYVHYANGYDNASWNGTAMQYGDGTGLAAGGLPPLTALDVCAHEIGHGVCASTANLTYSRESGAMNEGFSDIWGSVIEAYGDPHETDSIAKDRWLIGEELTTVFRSMKDPKKYGQPNTYLGQYWINASSTCNPSGANDNCGVHYNSGVLNYWFYLICSGGKGKNDLGNNYWVDSIGMAKAARIVYATELALNNNSNYAACRTASLAATQTIYGACSPEYQTISNAWYAVGVGPIPTPCTVQLEFNAPRNTSSEFAGVDGCNPDHKVLVPVSINGGTLSGDSAVVNIVVTGGNAVAGVDYQLLTPTLTFQPGGATSKNVEIVVFDNGTPNNNKFLDISYVLTAGASNANRSNLSDSTRIFIFDDDYVPYAGSSNERRVLTNATILNATSPFFGSVANAHARFLYTVDELYAAGIRPNVPITQAGFNVSTKASTSPYNGFNLNIGHTSVKDFSQAIPVVTFTNVYSDTLRTNVGMTLIPFTSAFVWNGVDNLVVDICYSNSGSIGGNDRVDGETGTFVKGAMASNTFNPGCSITLTTNNLVQTRPAIRFYQNTVVETAKNSTRSWELGAGESAYFYSSSDRELMAAVLSPMDSLGCVTVQVTEQGNGFKLASGGSQRSLKEFSIQPGAQLGSSSYDAIFYVNNAELAGVDPNLIKIIQTTSADDNNLISSNTQVVTPSSFVTGVDFIGFVGSFTGFGRFFLSNGNPALAVNPKISKDDQIWTGQNPFTAAPTINWTLPKAENVSIRLYDVAGRLVYGTDETLSAGTHALTLKSPGSLVPGAYVLQVIRPGGVFTSQMMKQ